jgi:hypothetical protein
MANEVGGFVLSSKAGNIFVEEGSEIVKQA